MNEIGLVAGVYYFQWVYLALFPLLSLWLFKVKRRSLDLNCTLMREQKTTNKQKPTKYHNVGVHPS